MQAESTDVLAALDFLRTMPFVDQRRLGIMGWSFGGIVTIFAASRSDAFRAVVDQAGGALTWNYSPTLREALPAAAQQVRAPVLRRERRHPTGAHFAHIEPPSLTH
jgi:dienelactone hydrolase